MTDAEPMACCIISRYLGQVFATSFLAQLANASHPLLRGHAFDPVFDAGGQQDAIGLHSIDELGDLSASGLG